MAGAYEITVQGAKQRGATTLTTKAVTPAQSLREKKNQSVTPPRLTAGTYRWRAGAITFNGRERTSTWRYFRLR